jgi:hypothetical protein
LWGGLVAAVLIVLSFQSEAATTQPATTQSATTQATDLSSPRGAARALWNAIRAGDVARVAEAIDTPDAKAKEFTQASAELLVAGKKLSDVASKHFGKSGQAIGRTMIDFNNIDDAVQKLQITETGDTAIAIGENKTNMRFQKRGGQWRLVVSEFANGTPANLAAQVKLLKDMSAAINEAAREIDSGKYQTAPEAERVIQDRLHAVMIEKFHPMNQPGTRPATLPATTRATTGATTQP